MKISDDERNEEKSQSGRKLLGFMDNEDIDAETVGDYGHF